jgi:hypothetical protein
MESSSLCLTVAVSFSLLAAQPAFGSVPGSMEITCDVQRTPFRAAAKNQTQVTFRLWNAETSGSQCGSDHVVLMKDLVVFRQATDRFDAQKIRRFERITAVLGSDASPVQLCGGAETWLDVTVGTTTFTCDFSADDDPNNPPPPPARKRLHSVPSAQQGMPADLSAVRAYASSNQVLSPPARVSLDTKTFDRLGEFSTVNGVFTASQAGYYSVSAATVLEDAVCAQAQVFTIRKNGVVYSQMKYAPPPVGTETPDNNPQINLSDIVDLAAGDTLELWLEAADCAQVLLFGGETRRDVTFLAIGRLP